ncbi:unnamed protein product [Didymodactylos carnosus]|uniref:Uncharacterized protein n=1 Tax=Didymodactylos carnosus TaxID=1234261 RepID=A0A814GHG2_9BILA|nr:unnamed protein product [Didymodactylos carnosus]CAF0996412.1 unnamed protein product [Didymodactylos carnosus]CAF3689171.1 unnamed protein product [Didymodactylos carnosus]CAF3768031.1 unnamed protein product [Didymodactylos carnosus]
MRDEKKEKIALLAAESDQQHHIYTVIFGQAPISDSDFWPFVPQNEILDDEDLPSPVAEDGDGDDDIAILKQHGTTFDNVVDPDVTKIL